MPLRRDSNPAARVKQPLLPDPFPPETGPARQEPAITPPPPPRRVCLLGATGPIGRATAAALLARGHPVTALIRPGEGADLPGVTLHIGDATDPAALQAALASAPHDAIVSCLASRTGAPADAWAIDHAAHMHAVTAARNAGVPRLILLSALCVQRPLLAFQQAKLAFEAAPCPPVPRPSRQGGTGEDRALLRHAIHVCAEPGHRCL